MREPRLPTFKEKLSIDFLPGWTSGGSSMAYKKYWIEDNYQPELISEEHHSDSRNIMWSYEMDMMEGSARRSYIAQFKRGKYIRWDYIKDPDSREWIKDETPNFDHYHISDVSNIFLKFVKLGKHKNPNEESVLAFIRKYGIPVNCLNPPFSGIYMIEHGFFPYQTVCDYAHEAYFIFSLYEALISKNTKRLHDSLLIALQYDCLRQALQDLLGGELVMVEIPTFLYQKYLDKLPIKLPDERVELLPSNPIFIGFLEGLYTVEGFDSWSEFYSDIAQYGDDEHLFRLTAKIISFFVSIRAGLNVRISTKGIPPENSGLATYSFKDIWTGRDLLSHMWFTFYLKITGKLEQEYKICPACKLPLIPNDGEKLRKNQIYHPGCRQMEFNRKKREVIKLYKEGKPLKEIAAVTGVKEVQIKTWLQKTF